MELIGLLMIEHRLIEQIIKSLEAEMLHISQFNTAHPVFIYGAVDFFRTYADRFHHGKEEDILFVELAKKPLSQEHGRIMRELEEEHVVARSTVGALVSATEKWSDGDEESLLDVYENLRKLSELYPRHIEKEDKGFFIPCQRYFNESERVDLLEAGYAFNKEFTNETYRGRMKSELDHRK